MSEAAPTPPPSRFVLTARQRRLRWTTAIVLVVIVVMVAYAAASPLFRPIHPLAITPHLRRALKVRILFVGLYWIVCFLLVALLPLLAWMDVRETLRKMATARRDLWREQAERARAKHRDTEGNGTQPS